MTTIIVGTDGSQPAHAATKWALQHLRATRAEGAGDDRLVLLTAVDTEDILGTRLDEGRPRLVEAADKLIRDEATWAKAQAGSDAHVSIESQFKDASPIEALREAVAAEHADLVAVGTHKGGVLHDAVIGSRGIRIASEIDAPVAVIPVTPDDDPQRSGIVVGVGPDNSSLKAIEFAVSVAERTGEKLQLISSWGLPEALSVPAAALGGTLDPVGMEFSHKLDAIVQSIKGSHPSVSVTAQTVEAPSPVQALVEAARAATLLVVGGHGRGTVGRLLLGSVGQGVLNNITSPVVVVPR